MPPVPPPSPPPAPAARAPRRITWRRISTTAVRWFHDYANWLVGISWKRFVLLSILLMVLASVLQKVPPFRLSWTEVLQDDADPKSASRPLASLPAQPRSASSRPRVPKDRDDEDVVISIDRDGVRIGAATAARGGPSGAAATASGAAAGTTPPPARTLSGEAVGSASTDSASTATAAPAAAGSDGTGASGAASGAGETIDNRSIRIELPGATRETLREAARAAREAAREAAAEAREAAAEARQEAAQAVEEARRDADEARREAQEAVLDARQTRRTHVVRLGDFLTDLAFLWIVASAIVKATYKGRVQAEVAAAAATETAESEQLKRQVVEARLAAMQAQVEPHFLFNTLASIDHLIETDPPRASQMQKNLIALLRASMPAMRETGPSAHRLGREMAVIRPYLEILKVRMEDRLRTMIEVPDGLLSADFPPMVIQGLVENAIKHGLEPKAEGGTLTVRAEIVDGRLAVTVADTGLGFGRGATGGTGTGLENMRQRLQLLYGATASMTIAENPPGGTVVTVAVPYQAHAEAAARAA